VRAVVAGGGLAGLSAAWGLRRAGIDTVVIESGAVPGGSASGFKDRNYTFDLVPQTLAARDPGIARLVEAWCGRPLLRGRRLARILVEGKLYRHPPDGRDLLGPRGPAVAAGMLAGRLQLRLGRSKEAVDYAAFMTARFGAPLYERFLAPIVEKITGLPASEIAGEVAHATLSSGGWIGQAFRRVLGKAEPDEEHLYPEEGFPALPEGLARALERAGVEVLLDHRVVALSGAAGRIGEVLAQGPRGLVRARADLIVSTLPIGALLDALPADETADARDAARLLRTRSLVVVHLGVRRDRLTEDHEILVPDPAVRFHRLSETVNHAPRMAPRGATGLTLEIACERHDAVWNEEDGAQVRHAIDDLCSLGFLRSTGEVEAGWVRRVPTAIPVMTLAHAGLRERIDRSLARFTNLRRCGREGGLRVADPVSRLRDGLEIAAHVGLDAARAA
jgi:UDP-galactopyranose mutase